MSAGYNPSPFLVNIIDLQNVTSNITGLSPLQVLSNSVANIQEMVNYDQKRIFVNTISKFNTTPIQVTDDINLSNSSLYVNGALFTGTGGSSGAGGSVYVSSGSTQIFLNSTTSVSSPAIGFVLGGRTIFSFDGAGRALYFDPSGTGNRFWISSATLVADQLQVGGAGLGAASGKVLTALDVSGRSIWNYPSTLQADIASVSISSGGVFFRTINDAGRIDAQRNWYLGNPALTGNNDLITSNDVTVVGGRLRYQGGGTPVVGAFLMIEDSLGNVKISTMNAGLSSFVVGDQIQSGAMNIAVEGGAQRAVVRNGATELARFTSSGSLGLGIPQPLSKLDVAGGGIFYDRVRISTISAVADYVYTAEDSTGYGRWTAPTRLFSSGTTQEFLMNTPTNDFRMSFASGGELIRFSTGGVLFGTQATYDVDVNGTVAASAFSSRSPLQFYLGKKTLAMYIAENGNVGLGTANPTERLFVQGNISTPNTIAAGGNMFVGGNITAATFAGNGASIGGIQTQNVGTGSNRLDTFQTQTRTDIAATQVSISTFSTVVYSSINSFNQTVGMGFYSTLSSYIQSTSNALSTQIYTNLGTELSTFSTSLLTGTGYFSTQIHEYASTIARVTASTLDGAVMSTTLSRGFTFQSTASLRFPSSVGALAAGYKLVGDLSGAIDVSGLIFSQGLRGIVAPFAVGVGQSTTLKFVKGGITAGQGWKVGIQGDIDISGNVYKNGVLYNPGYVNPWLYQGSNIYYNYGGVGIGPGVVSLSTTVHLDISGNSRYRFGPIYMERSTNTLGVGMPYGHDISGTLEVNGVLHTKRLEVEGTGIFGSRVTALEFLSLSDRNFKDKISPIEEPWKLLEPIRGKRYTWRDTARTDIGLIAQDVLQTLPEAVGGDIEKGLAVSYDKLIPVLVECIHDLRSEVNDLKLLLKKNAV
jgi:hypothetical protein